jgi:hypothetical protein
MQISCPSKAVNVKAVHRNIAYTCNKPTPGQGTVADTNLPRTMTPVSVANIQARKTEKQNTGRKKFYVKSATKTTNENEYFTQLQQLKREKLEILTDAWKLRVASSAT